MEKGGEEIKSDVGEVAPLEDGKNLRRVVTQVLEVVGLWLEEKRDDGAIGLDPRWVTGVGRCLADEMPRKVEEEEELRVEVREKLH